MTTWLIIRALGGLSFGLAHRYIVRRAWQESWAWGFCAMLIPGLSFLFAFRYRADLGRPLMAQVAGLALIAIGFTMSLDHAVAAEEERGDLAMGQAAANNASSLPEAFRGEVHSLQSTLKKAEALKEERATEIAANEQAITGAQPVSAAPVPAKRPADLAIWYHDLKEKRAKLDASDTESVARFNAEVASYQAALAESKKRDTLKPLKKELNPLPEKLKPLDNSLKPLPR